GDPLRYRTKEETAKWREEDPLGVVERRLLNKEGVEKETLDEIDDEVDAVMEEALKFADESPFPSEDTLFDHIFVED
ncbi:MAG: pyruvate dehydrogenase (acetyl-transferring) E1 component subunit alpha, partial [Anaerolineales bacterium]|nr:pyruvate dehydrogenase (acetyl-transferring) E1 component subunit alpha [Anaerolineales bacterium]